MKTKMTAGTIITLLLAGMLTLAFSPVASAGESTFVQGVLVTVPLWTWPEAWNVGTVTVAIEGENLVVTYETINGWEMLDTHLYVDTTWPGWWPPQWWNFPYKNLGLGGVTTDTYVISLASLGVGCDDTLYISTHANLIKYWEWGSISRHGWGQEEDPSEFGWTKYFTVTIPCVEKPGESPGWWKHQFKAYYEGKGKLHVTWADLVMWTDDGDPTDLDSINDYYGLSPPWFFGYPLPPVSSLDYDGSGTFTTDDAYHIFNDKNWNHMWTPLANWYNWASGRGPYW